MNRLFLIITGAFIMSIACDGFTPSGAKNDKAGLWSSAAELKNNPLSGPGWEAVKAAADLDFSNPVINDNNSNDDVNCLASAIVYARTGDQFYKDKVVTALQFNIAKGNPGFDRNGILTWCRNLGAYALAADLAGYRTVELKKWLRDMVETYRDPGNHNNTIEEIFYRRPNNWGTQAFGTLCAVYAYLGDSVKLKKIRDYWVTMVTGPNPGVTYGEDLSWHADQNNLRLINPPGSLREGLNIDGITPDDMRRNGVFSNPPPESKTSYHWEVLQGIVSGARILERVDPELSIWETADKAILRAVKILETDWRRDFNNEKSNWAATGDDAWMLLFIDAAYGTGFSEKTSDPASLWGHGKNAGWAYVLPQTDQGKNRYYSVTDFEKVRKTDVHLHINSSDPKYMELAASYNFRVVSPNVDSRIPLDEQLTTAATIAKKWPGQFTFLGTFSVENFGTGQFVANTIARIDKCIKEGASGIKIWKNIGMVLLDSKGKYVMIDDPAFDPIFSYLEEKKIPVVGHLGEPRNCWLPQNEMTDSANARYYRANPQYYMYLHPEAPSYEDQINARDNLLKKHPDLDFTGAHLASLEWNVDEIAERMELYPNMKVDLSARMAHLQYQSIADLQRVRNFFIKYHDRILYGTDITINANENDPDSRIRALVDRWRSNWIYLATDSTQIINNIAGPVKGLKLPADIIDKIYYKNADKFFGSR